MAVDELMYLFVHVSVNARAYCAPPHVGYQHVWREKAVNVSPQHQVGPTESPVNSQLVTGVTSQSARRA